MTMRRKLAPAQWLAAMGRSISNGIRASASVLAIVSLAVAALTFVFWNADWWVLRDKVEHVRAAVFGKYVSAACRADPENCRSAKPRNPSPTPVAGPVLQQISCDGRPGLQLHCQFHALYDYFNATLFEGRLPPALITLQRKQGVAGYFSHRRFKAADGKTIDEIALNPATFARVSMRELAATLVHEMVHLEQAHYGTPAGGGFHDGEWGRLMRRIGLQPSSTGKPGGAETGTRMTHYIVPDGPFDRAAREHHLIKGQQVALVE